jgi:hypothetical protein
MSRRVRAAAGRAVLAFVCVWLLALLCNTFYNWGWPDPWNWRPISRGITSYVAALVAFMTLPMTPPQ